MKRTQYGLNAQTLNANRWFDLTPLGYIETVPGESLSGQFDIEMKSDTTVEMIRNRAYVDIYLIYAPFRVLDENFPEFLINGTGSIPTVNNKFEFNYETDYNVYTGATATTNCAYQRYMYNMVWNKYFRRADETEANLTDNNVLSASTRPSTFHMSVPEGGTLVDETIDTSGLSLGVDDIRLAFQKDRFNKTRAMYGDRYVDYLNAVGVQADWTVLDEPEILARTGGQIRYQILNPSAADQTTPGAPVGNPGGYWTYSGKLKVGRKFIPEHGLIGLYAVPKIDIWSTRAHYPHLAWNQQEHFWSPDRDGARIQEYPAHIWATAADTTVQGMPQWEHLRKASSVTSLTTAAVTIDAYNATPATIADYKTDYGTLDAMFQGTMGNTAYGSAAHFSLVSYMKMAKQSPVAQRNLTPLT